MFSRVFFLILLHLYAIESARILIMIPSPSISHQLVFRPFTQELLRLGHEIVVITSDPAFPKGQAPANLTEVDLHDITYNAWREQFINIDDNRKQNVYQQIVRTLKVLQSVFINQIKSDKVRDVIRNKEFDLLVIEAYFRPALFLSHIFKVPVIQMSSFGSVGNNKVSGSSIHTLLYPELYRHRCFNLTLWETLKELYMEYMVSSFIENHQDIENHILRSAIDSNMPDVRELINNVDMVFLNLHPMWDMNRPVTPGLKYLGSLHLQGEKDMPKEIKNYLDASMNGVIYVSFGTNVNPSQLPQAHIDVIKNVFSQLPYDFLWKWDKDEMPGKPKNIRISKWLPQSDLLRHPKIKLFITQAGLQSTDEAIAAGVPLIGIPMLYDQWCNAEKYVHHKIGLKLEFASLSEEELKNAIRSVIEDESYRRNVVQLRALMYDQPQRPLERAVWWTEHVLRHGGAEHLRAPAANMGWAEYLELELVVLILLIALVIIYLLCKVLLCIASYVTTYLKGILK